MKKVLWYLRLSVNCLIKCCQQNLKKKKKKGQKDITAKANCINNSLQVLAV